MPCCSSADTYIILYSESELTFYIFLNPLPSEPEQLQLAVNKAVGIALQKASELQASTSGSIEQQPSVTIPRETEVEGGEWKTVTSRANKRKTQGQGQRVHIITGELPQTSASDASQQPGVTVSHGDRKKSRHPRWATEYVTKPEETFIKEDTHKPRLDWRSKAKWQAKKDCKEMELAMKERERKKREKQERPSMMLPFP